jgi:hypothetical protein
MRRFPPPWSIEKIPGGLKVCVPMASRVYLIVQTRGLFIDTWGVFGNVQLVLYHGHGATQGGR